MKQDRSNINLFQGFLAIFSLPLLEFKVEASLVYEN